MSLIQGILDGLPPVPFRINTTKDTESKDYRFSYEMYDAFRLRASSSDQYAESLL